MMIFDVLVRTVILTRRPSRGPVVAGAVGCARFTARGMVRASHPADLARRVATSVLAELRGCFFVLCFCCSVEVAVQISDVRNQDS